MQKGSRLEAGSQAAVRHDLTARGLASRLPSWGTGSFVWSARPRRCPWWSSAILIDASGLALMSLGFQYQRSMKK
jgi:hypothetical protein